MLHALRSTFLLALTLILCGFVATSAFAQTSEYASGWTAPAPTWTPAPPSSNPLGAPNSACVGTTNAPTVWAQFTFDSFGLPGGATIVGIEVNVNYGTVLATTLELYMGGSMIGSPRVLASTPPTSTCNASVIRTAGGPADLWGTSLTAADFNSAGAVAVRLTRTTGPDSPVSIDIESIQLVVYTSADNSDPDCSGAAIADQIANASCQATISGSDVTGVTDPDGDMLTIMVSPTTLSLGANSVTVNADDGNGGTCSEMITVNVIDVTDPMITCPANVTLNANASCEVTYSTPPATATDNCSVSVSSAPPLPALFSGVGGNTITYTATDGAGNAVMCDQTVTVKDVTLPVITLNGVNPQTLECAIDSYTELGATVTDNCDDTPSLVIDDSAVDVNTTGSYPVTYNATDESNNAATQTVRTVVVEDTTPPEIFCPADATLFADAVCQATYTGPPATATDACDASPTVSSAPPLPATFMGVGDNTIGYTATDADDNDAMCDQTVSIEDITPPTITLVEGPIELWPPNHKYHTIGLGAIVTEAADNCDGDLADDVVTTEVSSDEPENAQGDGNTTDDIDIAGDCRSVDLRAERQGGGNGRVYTLELAVADLSGNVGTGAFGVHVPHSKKSGAIAGPGPGYSVLGCMPARIASMEETGATAQVEQMKETDAETPEARLKDAFGETPEETLEVAAEQTPEAFALVGNYPNPFNPETRIRFAVPESAHVKLLVYDVLGRQVRVLVDGQRAAGMHEAVFDASTLPSGTYLYWLDTPAGSFVGSMLLVK